MVLQRTVQERVKDANNRMSELLDWLAKTEKALGSQQPMAEEAGPLTEQYNQHKVSWGFKSQRLVGEGASSNLV